MYTHLYIYMHKICRDSVVCQMGPHISCTSLERSWKNNHFTTLIFNVFLHLSDTSFELLAGSQWTAARSRHLRGDSWRPGTPEVCCADLENCGLGSAPGLKAPENEHSLAMNKIQRASVSLGEPWSCVLLRSFVYRRVECWYLHSTALLSEDLHSPCVGQVFPFGGGRTHM